MKTSTSLDQWFARFSRMQDRSRQYAQDLRRDITWHVRGGNQTFQRYYPELVSAHKWCFIVGCNNSGTSLLHSILDRTGVVSTFPYEGQRYTRVLKRATKKGFERVWSEYLDELRLTTNNSTSCAPRLLFDWLGELNQPIQDIIVEKTTANAVRMEWLQRIFPRSCFIGIVRNGYAVVEGIRRKGRKSVERGARHWNLANKIMTDDSRNIDNYLELRYEDLVSSSSGALVKLSEFMNIDEHLLEKAMEENFGFSTIRGDGGLPVRNLNADSIEKLSDEDKRVIRNEASEMLDYFGYKS